MSSDVSGNVRYANEKNWLLFIWAFLDFSKETKTNGKSLWPGPTYVSTFTSNYLVPPPFCFPSPTNKKIHSEKWNLMYACIQIMCKQWVSNIQAKQTC